MSTTGNPTSEQSGNTVAEEAGAAETVGSCLHLIGGTSLDVLQGVQVARRRLEAAHETGEGYVAFTQPPRGPVFVNPLQVKYVVQPRGDGGGREGRAANARIHFADGSSIDVLQGSGVANKRLSEARAALSLFATFVEPGGNQVFVNCATVTHLAPEPASEQVPEPGATSARTT